MKLDTKTLNIALIIGYIICIMYTAYILFTLQNDLIYESHALNISDANKAAPVLTKLYIAVAFTLVLGMASIVAIFRRSSQEVVYIENKTSSSKKGGQADTTGKDASAGKKMELGFIDELIKSEKNKKKLAEKGLVQVCKKLDAGIGVLYSIELQKDSERKLTKYAAYALSLGESESLEYEFGEGLVGQVAKEEKTIWIDDVPDGYIKIVSGLGSSSPTHLLIAPIYRNKQLFGVLELASFSPFDKQGEEFAKNSIEKLLSHDNKASTTQKNTEAGKASKKDKAKHKED